MHFLRNHQENHKKSASYLQITTKSIVNYKLLTVNYKLLFPTSASYSKAVPSRTTFILYSPTSQDTSSLTPSVHLQEYDLLLSLILLLSTRI